jgi:hypothetical protein
VIARLAGGLPCMVAQCWRSMAELAVVLLLEDLPLRCFLDASIVVTEVTDTNMSEAHISIFLLLGGAQTNGRWRCGCDR